MADAAWDFYGFSISCFLTGLQRLDFVVNRGETQGPLDSYIPIDPIQSMIKEGVPEPILEGTESLDAHMWIWIFVLK